MKNVWAALAAAVTLALGAVVVHLLAPGVHVLFIIGGR
jgi:hypothetical protein